MQGLLAAKIASVACGGACTACVDQEGLLWAWGSTSWNQCGHGAEKGARHTEGRTDGFRWPLIASRRRLIGYLPR